MASRPVVALLYGGRSGEHAVSLRSAESVARGLAARHHVVPVLVDRDGRWFLQPGPEPRPDGGERVFLVPAPDDGGALRALAGAAVVVRPDVYFPVLHGTYGEDGTVQGLLELAGVAYVGSGVAGSAAAMDKALMRALFAQAGLPLAAWRVLRAEADTLSAREALVAELGLPLFVKPANLGSSVGISKVHERGELGAALASAFAYDHKAVVEAAVDAREIELSVLGNEAPEASQPGEVVPDREFYDYASKYSAASRTELCVPAPLVPELAEQARALALAAFRAVDACGYARVDLFLERGSGRLLVNEINTIPGFTSISMFPKLWQASGLGYEELLGRLVTLGCERHARRSRLRTDYAP